jgi:hypothetical protein
MSLNHVLISFAVSLLLSVQVFAQEAAGTTSTDAASTRQEQAPKAPASNAKILPRLAVRWSCGDCEQNPKVVPLIVNAYETDIAAKGYTISPSESAEMVITDYRQRPPAVRSLFGIMAGKDRLGTTLVFRGKEYVASDYSANAWFGMNSLCESVAQQAVTQVLSAVNE